VYPPPSPKELDAHVARILAVRNPYSAAAHTAYVEAAFAVRSGMAIFQPCALRHHCEDE